MEQSVAAAAILADHPHCYTIAVKQRAHFPGGQVNVIAAFITTDEAKAILVAGYCAGEKIQTFEQAVFTAPVLDDLSRPDHFPELAAEFGPVFFSRELVVLRYGIEV